MEVKVDYKQARYDQIRGIFDEVGQAHVFDAWKILSEAEKEILIGQCERFDVNEIKHLFRTLVLQRPAEQKDQYSTPHYESEEIEILEPVESEQVVSKPKMDKVELAQLSSEGKSLIKEGLVAVVV